jgi:hypothetical protein
MAKDFIKIKLSDIKIRKNFSRSPSEQVEEPKKNGSYKRAQTRFEIQKQLEEEADDNQDLDFGF